MNKFGLASLPQSGDDVTININNGKQIIATVVSWGVEQWNQCWAVVKIGSNIEQVNLAHITSYTVSKIAQSAQAYKIIKDATDEEGGSVYNDNDERVKITKIVKASTSPKYHIVRRNKNVPQNISKTITEGSKVVKEPEVSLDNSLAGKDPIEQAQTLVQLYKQKSRLVSEQISDHLNDKELKEPEKVYAMPSFEKRTTPKT
jgi:hypothetical protein